MTDALEKFLNHQAESTTKFILKDPKNQIALGLEKKYVRDNKNDQFANSNLSKISTKKSTNKMTGRHESTKSPLDLHDVTKLKNKQIDGEIGKFNQSSSQNLDIPNL